MLVEAQTSRLVEAVNHRACLHVNKALVNEKTSGVADDVGCEVGYAVDRDRQPVDVRA